MTCSDAPLPRVKEQRQTIGSADRLICRRPLLPSERQLRRAQRQRGPVGDRLPSMSQLIEHGEVRRGRLGIGIQDLTLDLAEAFQFGSFAARSSPDGLGFKSSPKAKYSYAVECLQTGFFRDSFHVRPGSIGTNPVKARSPI
jgi:hypothetical protein